MATKETIKPTETVETAPQVEESTVGGETIMNATIPSTIAQLREIDPFAETYKDMPAMLEVSDIDYALLEDVFMLLAEYEDFDNETINNPHQTGAERMRMIVAFNHVSRDLLDKVAVDNEEFERWLTRFNPLEQFGVLSVLVNVYSGVAGK